MRSSSNNLAIQYIFPDFWLAYCQHFILLLENVNMRRVPPPLQLFWQCWQLDDCKLYRCMKECNKNVSNRCFHSYHKENCNISWKKRLIPTKILLLIWFQFQAFFAISILIDDWALKRRGFRISGGSRGGHVLGARFPPIYGGTGRVLRPHLKKILYPPLVLIVSHCLVKK